MVTKTTSGIVMTATLIAFGFAAQTARAETIFEPDLTYEQMLNAPIGVEQAMSIAREQARGRVIELSMEEFNSKPVYQATIAAPTSLTEVTISADDGAVLSTARQTAATPELMQQLIEEDIEDVMEFAALMDGELFRGDGHDDDDDDDGHCAAQDDKG
ncbi:PepSY domain-containing protein [Phaeobacter gallaeciensis]|uniref:PepSY domain-containing protein n=1 Tax=Phaeobacter gallaeciensis TaxID=60890 RepID=UPI000BBBE83A|nr:PepSY domain-containing protein [Phaeobacter gallaeciensis]ATF18647.1 Peptidase propeptide and YPEB domain protein [Phaeobacter gallaeciensis]ATF22756.1 Peptidase propeptide and YPEB domain protein [Phaeobacter gallaeciensis]